MNAYLQFEKTLSWSLAFALVYSPKWTGYPMINVEDYATPWEVSVGVVLLCWRFTFVVQGPSPLDALKSRD